MQRNVGYNIGVEEGVSEGHSAMGAQPHVGDETPTSAIRPAGFPRFRLYYLGLGALGFGGPIAAVGYMQRDLVEERRWLDRQDLLDGIALGQTMPGPLAAQVAMGVGYLRRGAVGLWERLPPSSCLVRAGRGARVLLRSL